MKFKDWHVVNVISSVAIIFFALVLLFSVFTYFLHDNVVFAYITTFVFILEIALCTLKIVLLNKKYDIICKDVIEIVREQLEDKNVGMSCRVTQNNTIYIVELRINTQIKNTTYSNCYTDLRLYLSEVERILQSTFYIDVKTV